MKQQKVVAPRRPKMLWFCAVASLVQICLGNSHSQYDDYSDVIPSTTPDPIQKVIREFAGESPPTRIHHDQQQRLLTKDGHNVDGDNEALQLQHASKWLFETFGISGLCHPTLDNYAPEFPRCNTTNNNKMKTEDDQKDNVPVKMEKTTTSRRQLSQNYYNYYDNLDDNVDDNYEDKEDDALSTYQYYYRHNYVNDDKDNDADEDMPIKEGKWFYIIKASLAFLCVIAGALASGLTVSCVQQAKRV